MFLLRHGRSVSNELLTHPCASVQELGRWVLDPPLSQAGVAETRAYAQILRARLAQRAFLKDDETILICSSGLLRAQQTARLLFGRDPVVVPHFGEIGNFPENTPGKESYQAPDFEKFVRYAAGLVGHQGRIIGVGHGLFLGGLRDRLMEEVDMRGEWEGSNLDGYMVEVSIGPGSKITARIGDSMVLKSEVSD